MQIYFVFLHHMTIEQRCRIHFSLKMKSGFFFYIKTKACFCLFLQLVSLKESK